MTKSEAIRINTIANAVEHDGDAISEIQKVFKVNYATAKDMLRQAREKAARRNPENG
jgi:transposase